MNLSAPTSMIPQFPPAWAEVFGEDDFGIFAECSMKSVRFVWRWVMPGEFMMGSPESEKGRYERERLHKVTLTQGFWLGETPVTQAQWQAVTGENPSQFKGEQLPVESVSWDDCQVYVTQLNELLPGLNATLPTEAQWEYACRAGTETAFNDGSACTKPEGKDPALDQLGWYEKNSGGKTHVVKELDRPNAWGLHDMHGNVWEWCRDAWEEDAYRKHSPVDPEITWTEKSAERVLRGGSWIGQAQCCRAAYRARFHPGSRWRALGLRLAAGQNEPRAAEPQGAERLPLPERRSRARRAGGSLPA